MCLADLHGRQLIQALATLGILACGLDAKGQTPEPTLTPEPSKSAQAPYFAVQGTDDGVDHFPMKETKVEVKLNGVIATVHVHQHYRNEGKKPINAKYIFPGSTRAAMNAMTMTVGNRRIKAQIKEKEQAQKMFEAAKAAGQTASLLSQKRPNVFSMDVANIGVGAEVDVEMDYTEFLASTEGEYEFVYPGVVGPRYGGDANRTDAPTEWIRSPYLHAGDKSPVGFDLTVQLDTPFALNDLTSTSHKVIAQWNGPKSVKVLGYVEPVIETKRTVELVEIDTTTSSAAGIPSFVRAIADAVEARDVDALMRLDEPRTRPPTPEELARYRAATADLFLSGDLRIFNTRSPEPGRDYRLYHETGYTYTDDDYLCFCKQASCEGRWPRAGEIFNANPTRPWVCYRVARQNGRWYFE